MDPNEFKDFSKDMTSFIVNYLENIRERRVLPTVEPGYMKPLLPEEAPQKAEDWQNIMNDLERVIMPGVTHWHSPKFHAYFPTAQSYPAIVADMLSGAIACIGFTWGTASEATLVALLGAKVKKIKQVKEQHPDWSDSDIVGKLVAYGSAQAHSSVERAGLLGGVKHRLLETDSKHQLRGETLAEAIQADKENGLIPFYVVGTLGTTSSCTFDRIDELGPICNSEEIWLHVDAAYAGSAFICPEFRYLMRGVERADSFNFNPHKWMLVNFDCSPLWLKDPTYVINAFNVDPLYLKHDMQGSAPDYRHWQIPLGRRFRALKLWFVLRLYGVENLQKYIRNHVAQAHEFESLVLADPRFEVVEEVVLGLVCFRLKVISFITYNYNYANNNKVLIYFKNFQGSNELNELLLKRINGAGNIHLVPSKINDCYFLRLAICSRFSESKDIQYSWQEIKTRADEVLKENSA
ncbi:unnamed protein product [Trichogramma brassicae]|uniref:Aromatic-L-amino-acid decarboxylase n=1 Tax=Trichogramma brassicae TaxID=86971 RepID=A0A6H5IJT4_9HYME|nr:unnamed protein product [Trichogramma brassicae]